MVYLQYSNTLSLECPHCDTRCQFSEIDGSHHYCRSRENYHIAYVCSHCGGIVVTVWDVSPFGYDFFAEFAEGYPCDMGYYPRVGNWKPRVNLRCIKNNEVREDFKEAIDCYNNGFYNACMIMARRAIQQEMTVNKVEGDNLYQQIESMGISERLKTLLHKVKNFGNYGAHPDFSLFDADGERIDNKEQFAELSLEFLDRYFSDRYEINALVESAPKSTQELDPKVKNAPKSTQESDSNCF